MTYDFEPLWACINAKMQSPYNFLQPNACAQDVPHAVQRLGSNEHALEVSLFEYVLSLPNVVNNCETRGRYSAWYLHKGPHHALSVVISLNT